MTAALLDELAALHPWLPDIFKIAALALAVTVTWIVVSWPAQWVYRALQAPLQKLSFVVEACRQRMMGLTVSFFAHRSTPVSRYVAEHRHTLSLEDMNASLHKRLAKVRGAIEAVPQRAQALERSLSDAQKTVKDNSTTVQRIQWPALIEAPTASQYTTVRIAENDANLRVFVFGFMAILLIAINTFMLKEFFASFIPPLRMLGISLPVVFALLFSILEMTFGACIAFTDTRSTSATLTKILILALVVVLGVIEAGFYAEFGIQNKFNPFAIIWSPGPSPAWVQAWFGVFGPLVVFGLALSGERLFSAAREIWRNRVIKDYKKFLDLRTRNADEVSSKLEAARKSSSLLMTVLKEITADANSHSEALSRSNSDLIKSKAEIEAILTDALQASREPFSDVPASEMLRSYLTCLFQAASVAVAYFVIALSFGAFGFNAPISVGATYLPGLAVAIGEVVLMLGAGLASARVIISTAPTGSWVVPRVAGVSVLSVMAYAIAASVIVANAILFLNRGAFFDFMWFSFTCAACFWLFAVGRRLGLILAAIWALAQTLAVTAAYGAVYAAAATLLAFRAGIHLLLTALDVLALPYRLIFRKKASEQLGAIVTQSAAAFSIMALLFGTPAAKAQSAGVDLQSTISVLVDLSSTWHTPSQKKENEKILSLVSATIMSLANEYEPPIAIRYYPIGNRSLSQPALCEVVFVPKLLAGQLSTIEVNTPQKLREYLFDSCTPHVLAQPQARFTDISGAFDTVGRMMKGHPGAKHSIIALSDFKEELAPGQKAATPILSSAQVALLYRVLDEDKPNPKQVDIRVTQWSQRLQSAGAKVADLHDITASVGAIKKALK